MRGALTCAALAALALPAQAQEGVWWCDADGPERLNYDGGGIQFNEHTLCSAEQQIALTAANEYAWSGAVACENIYVTGEAADGSLVTTAVPLDTPDWLALVFSPENTLTLYTDRAGPGRVYVVC